MRSILWGLQGHFVRCSFVGILAVICLTGANTALAEPFYLARTGQFLSFYPGDDGDLRMGFPLSPPRFTYNVQPVFDTGADGAHSYKCVMMKDPQTGRDECKLDQYGQVVRLNEPGIAGNGICDGHEICDGTVTDNLTGLVWLYDPTCVGTSSIPGYVEFQSFPHALESAKKLRSGTDRCNHPHPDALLTSGLLDASVEGDWRLPTVRELRSLGCNAYYEPVISNWQGTSNAVPNNPFHYNLVDEKTWTSTSYARDPEKAWYINSQNGNVASDNKRIAHQVFPVRGPKPGRHAFPAQSGQKKCYNPMGISYPPTEPERYPNNPLREIDCVYDPSAHTPAEKPYYDPSGQDGVTQTGYKWDAETRFTDNGNGTVKDNLTGLTWTKRAHRYAGLGGTDWPTAMNLVARVGSGTGEGFGLSDGSSPGDWRMPNLFELWSLIDYNEYGQNYVGDHGHCYGDCEGEALPANHPFIIEDDPRMGWYWTSSAYAAHVKDENQQEKGKYLIKPLGGAIVSHAADINGWFWPVKGKSYSPSVVPWVQLLLLSGQSGGGY